MVEYINDAYFEKALQELEFVEDWTFDSDKIEERVDIDNAIDFIRYADSISTPTCKVDSFASFIISEIETIVYYYIYNDDYEQAEKYMIHALEIQREIWGEYSKEYAKIFYDFGLIYFEAGEYTLGEQLLSHSLEIEKNVLGETNPKYAVSLYCTGKVYFTIGNYEQAEIHFLKAADIEKNLPGESIYDYASTLAALGVLYRTCSLPY